VYILLKSHRVRPFSPFTRYVEGRKGSKTLPYIERFYYPQEVGGESCSQSGMNIIMSECS